MNFTKADYAKEFVSKEDYKFTVELDYVLTEDEKDALYKAFRKHFGALFFMGFRKDSIDIGYTVAVRTDEEMFNMVCEIVGTTTAKCAVYTKGMEAKEKYRFTVEFDKDLTDVDKYELYDEFRKELGSSVKFSFRKDSFDVYLRAGLATKVELFNLISNILDVRFNFNV